MATFKEALLRYRRQEGITQREAAARLGVSQTTYYNWEAGSFLPHVKYVAKLAEVLKLSPEQLLTMERTQLAANRASRHRSDLLSVPVLGLARAGLPADTSQEQQVFVGDYVGVVPAGAFGVRVWGDSMQSEGRSIPNGSLCICEPAQGIPPDRLVGKVVCVRLEGEEHCIKQLIKFAGEFQLQSWNPRYQLLPIKNPEAAVEGVVRFVVQAV